MKKIGIVIQARMASTRLPGKVLRDFCGRPMLGFQIDFLKKLPEKFPIVVATSVNPLDDAVQDFCQKEKVECFRGDEANVFSRVQAVVEKYGFETLIRLTADNPLVHWRILKACLEEHSRTGPDLTSTREILPDRSVKRYAPMGLSVDVLKGKALLSVDESQLNDFEKEHVIPVFFNGKYKTALVKNFESMPSASYSVDTKTDLERMTALVGGWIRENRLEKEMGL